jgi:hydroxypyruvate isomerase
LKRRLGACVGRVLNHALLATAYLNPETSMTTITRRDVLTGAAAFGAAVFGSRAAAGLDAPFLPLGRLKQSVSRWPFRDIPLAEFCRAVRDMGIVAIDLLYQRDWAVVSDCGLVCSMGYPGERSDFIARGFNDPANHPLLLRELEATIPAAAAHGVPNVIAMFGNREGRSDREAIDSCVTGLSAIAPLAEEHGVTVCVELLNSKVDHADYQGDRTAFGVEVMRGVDSPRVKLLYDIYHMQIMEGDVIRTIRDHIDHIAHFHTAGVPGRHELDDRQELNWPAIARAIADTGFQGYFAHEFVPTGDPLTSLRQAVAVCEV